jgi:hypothetical protein
MIYTLFVFDRHGVCLLFREWNKVKRHRGAPAAVGSAAADSKSSKSPALKTVQHTVEDEQKLMFGLIFSSKIFANQMSPRVLQENESDNLYTISTKEFKVHCLETLTGLRWALTTDAKVPRMQDALRRLYQLYVDTCMKNPLYKLSQGFADVPIFTQQMEMFVTRLPHFSTVNAGAPVKGTSSAVGEWRQ